MNIFGTPVIEDENLPHNIFKLVSDKDEVVMNVDSGQQVIDTEEEL